MIRGIVFDLWNCLARNTRPPNPMLLLARALGIAGRPGWTRRLGRGMMLAPGAGIEAALRQIEAREGLTIRDAALRDEVIRRWRADADAALYPDAKPVLAALHGRYRLGVCSNTQSFGLEFLDREGIWSFLDASAFSFEVRALKPRPEVFAAISLRLGLPPEQLLMVGDHPGDDVAGARACGMRAVRLVRDEGEGSREAPRAAPGEEVLHGLEDLADYLRGPSAGG